ncbi:MAG: RNP-1 like protein RNA-binding protein [Microgenomates group bacterium GW2011_GWF2_45_18]|nr:MAG: RNP-1 like protein RNA-binding protein [Microgenomates group bacterium GW2011_GWF1_44_10]KKU01520.1 MAG: RNP-1 like protein RNA-binding protein [Microgenomates group bacterium GW2011_GWF2_45_18]OGJ41431.1 MAG: hypothetical protein A2378_00210 [Candidatus Pacebacteria bacterium RIFOXYB1_FULL_44_10]HAU99427.1 RNA-binding protein [Candidatus Paceibacterota bacterium]HAX01567.1 RNA-binding protein [Candidatus Paceibacterota bacterium]
MDQNNKLYIGNLEFSVTTDELKELFAQFGTVTDAIVMVDKFSGRSRGFGFVTFATDKEASEAQLKMAEQDFKGRKLIVSVARPMSRDNNAGGGGFRPRNNFSRDDRGGNRGGRY